MKIIQDAAEMGEDVVIIAEEETSDDVTFDAEGNMVQPQEDQIV